MNAINIRSAAGKPYIPGEAESADARADNHRMLSWPDNAISDAGSRISSRFDGYGTLKEVRKPWGW